MRCPASAPSDPGLHALIGPLDSTKVDEYQLEIQSLRRTLARLRDEEADSALIEEYETEYRNLSSLYQAATDTFYADRSEPRLPVALASLGFGDWTLNNVYSFVYDASMELPVDDGRELARRIDETDYAASLLAVLDVED
jgi:hypothetical protein